MYVILLIECISFILISLGLVRCLYELSVECIGFNIIVFGFVP